MFPPLHIKLGLMKQFVKALDKTGQCFQYISAVFPGLSNEKLKAGIFDGPQIRTLIKDSNFQYSMNEIELASWLSFVEVVQSFLRNRKAYNYKDIVQKLLDNFRALGINMRKTENLGDVSDKQGERFHQNIKVMKERYQDRWDKKMMSYYCWCLKQDKPDSQHSRKSKTQVFAVKMHLFMYFLLLIYE